MSRRAAVLLLLPSVAHAGPSWWALSEPVLHGDGVQRGASVTVEDVVVAETEGLVTIRACCGLVDLAECPDSSTYEIGWALDAPVDVLGRGDDVNVTLSNVRTSGSCSDIDPMVVVAGDNGNPADSLAGLGVTFDGPVGIFDDALAGGRYYATNSDPHTDHDNSVRTVSLYDADTMLEEGYFHIDIAHRWGLQYEVVWVYEATDDPTGGDGADTGCSHAGPSPALPGLALLTVAGLARRRARVGRTDTGRA